MATQPSTFFQLQHFVQLLQFTQQNLNPLNPPSCSPPFHHHLFQSRQSTNSGGCLYQKTYQVTLISAHQQGGRRHRRLVCPIHRILCNSSGVELLKCAHDFHITSHDKYKIKNKPKIYNKKQTKNLVFIQNLESNQPK